MRKDIQLPPLGRERRSVNVELGHRDTQGSNSQAACDFLQEVDNVRERGHTFWASQ